MSQKPKYCKNFERNSHWRKLFMIMVWERYCNASPKPEFFLFSLFIFSFISQLIWVRLGWNFHRWFSIQKQVNWCTIDPFSLKFCTGQHLPSTFNALSCHLSLSFEHSDTNWYKKKVYPIFGGWCAPSGSATVTPLSITHKHTHIGLCANLSCCRGGWGKLSNFSDFGLWKLY